MLIINLFFDLLKLAFAISPLVAIAAIFLLYRDNDPLTPANKADFTLEAAE